jgi:dATP/dGTP diphosphohydrolase
MTAVESNFKVGDKVVVTTSVYDVTVSQGEPKPPKKGAILEVVERCTSADKGVWIDDKTVEVETINEPWQAGDFVLYVEESSIARPVLEERKVGKVKMQLFDEGFPNAIMEVAKVMTWAETAKGYQPNDFKNLPNSETEFAAAASRHRVKGFIQKANGVPAIGRTDEESNIVHLAHAAFNILAELELVLTGKIK